MILFSNTIGKEAMEKVSERVAAAIAQSIIKAQRFLSSHLNHWFSDLTATQKKALLVTLGLLISASLLSGVFSSFYSIPKVQQLHYMSAHIGQASGLPNLKPNNRKITDSLTFKK